MRIAIATFAEEGPFLRARTRALAAERRIVGEWTPYALVLPGDGTRGIRPAAILGGLAGALALFALTTWSAYTYPFDQGGRPLFAWQAFILSPVEFGALAAAAAGIVLFFRNARLTRLHDGAFDLPEIASVSQGAFVLVLACDAGEDANAALALLAETGATHSRLFGP